MDLSPVTLEGAHVRLEPLSLDHVDALAAVGLDPSIWEWTTSLIRTRDEMRRWVATALDWARAGTCLPFATRERASGVIVGSTRLANAEPAHGRIEIGWTWIAPAWQRTAVNTEAKLLMLAHAFERLGVRRVELKTDALNARSRAAIARLGAVEEGTLRRHMITDGGRPRDSVYFSILDDEWPALRERLTNRLAAG